MPTGSYRYKIHIFSSCSVKVCKQPAKPIFRRRLLNSLPGPRLRIFLCDRGGPSGAKEEGFNKPALLAQAGRAVALCRSGEAASP